MWMVLHDSCRLRIGPSGGVQKFWWGRAKTRCFASQCYIPKQNTSMNLKGGAMQRSYMLLYMPNRLHYGVCKQRPGKTGPQGRKVIISVMLHRHITVTCSTTSNSNSRDYRRSSRRSTGKSSSSSSRCRSRVVVVVAVVVVVEEVVVVGAPPYQPPL